MQTPFAKDLNGQHLFVLKSWVPFGITVALVSPLDIGMPYFESKLYYHKWLFSLNSTYVMKFEKRSYTYTIYQRRTLRVN